MVTYDVLYPNILTQRQIEYAREKLGIKVLSAVKVDDAGLLPVSNHLPYFYFFVAVRRGNTSRYALEVARTLTLLADKAGSVVDVIDVSEQFDYVYWYDGKRWRKFKAHVFKIMCRAPYDVPRIKYRMEAILLRFRDDLRRLVQVLAEGTSECEDIASRESCVLLGAVRWLALASRIDLKYFGGLFGFSGFNIKYTIRVSWDYNIRFFNAKPIYYGTIDIGKALDVRLKVLDIETIGEKAAFEACMEKLRGERCKERLEKIKLFVGLMEHWLGEEPKEDNAYYYLLPEEMDEFLKDIRRTRILLGHNIIGYDIPRIAYVLGKVLAETENEYLGRQREATETVKRVLLQRLVLDNARILEAHSSSFQIGAVRSLEDVAKLLSREAGIPRDRLKLKVKVGGRVGRLPLGELKKYNFNDLWLTAAVGNVFVPFILVVSALFQIPPSIVQSSFAGVLGESYMFRLFELNGILLGYARAERVIEAPKVFIEPMLSEKAVREIAEIVRRYNLDFDKLEKVVRGVA